MVVGPCVAERAMRQGHADVRYGERGDRHRKCIKTDAQKVAAPAARDSPGSQAPALPQALPAPMKDAAGPENGKGQRVSAPAPSPCTVIAVPGCTVGGI